MRALLLVSLFLGLFSSQVRAGVILNDVLITGGNVLFGGELSVAQTASTDFNLFQKQGLHIAQETVGNNCVVPPPFTGFLLDPKTTLQPLVNIDSTFTYNSSVLFHLDPGPNTLGSVQFSFDVDMTTLPVDTSFILVRDSGNLVATDPMSPATSFWNNSARGLEVIDTVTVSQLTNGEYRFNVSMTAGAGTMDQFRLVAICGPSAVPEPTSLALLSVAGLLGGFKFRKKFLERTS